MDLEAKYDGPFVNGKMETTKMAQYTFKNGTYYEGSFKNGTFHGKGTLHFPGKGKYVGEWRQGALVEGSYVFDDGLPFETETDWSYCTAKDRKYWGEHQQGLRAGGEELLRSERHDDRKLAPGTFDVMDGAFDPTTGQVHHYDSGESLYAPDETNSALAVEKAFRS